MYFEHWFTNTHLSLISKQWDLVYILGTYLTLAQQNMKYYYSLFKFNVTFGNSVQLAFAYKYSKNNINKIC